MPPCRPPNSSAQDKSFYKFVLLLLGGPLVIAIVAVNTGYFFGSIFVGMAVLVLLLSILADMSARLPLYIAALILVGLSLPFIIPWDKSSGPGLTNDDRYQMLLNESAYSCQPEHYDQQNCRAQKQGLDGYAKLLTN
jgi:hypothetical protein